MACRKGGIGWDVGISTFHILVLYVGSCDHCMSRSF